eukprot:CAMPEP_0117653158 /NCGR_PEP_ID=MMETSP0804-20121206/3036_1 /TAXON_ID=1074897 /ORGANISM="Tetraselmis astigmatica, Strain CCMP880" /LENGTH=180 /DNA_ID=CAMNT_0005459303 /DNA_START=92 /DNA_END=635 /DNA_ORIENTATION=-
MLVMNLRNHGALKGSQEEAPTADGKGTYINKAVHRRPPKSTGAPQPQPGLGPAGGPPRLTPQDPTAPPPPPVPGGLVLLCILGPGVGLADAPVYRALPENPGLGERSYHVTLGLEVVCFGVQLAVAQGVVVRVVMEEAVVGQRLPNPKRGHVLAKVQRGQHCHEPGGGGLQGAVVPLALR